MAIAVVAALPEEIAPLARRLAGREPEAVGRALQCSLDGLDVWLMVSGDGPSRAHRTVNELLTTISVEALIGMGVAGGLTDDLALGDLVVVDAVLDETTGRRYSPEESRWLGHARKVPGARIGGAVSASAIAGDAESKKRLSGLLDGSAVVDLESAAWCEAASDAEVACVIARAVTDSHDEALPLDFESLRNESGGVDRSRVLRAAVVRPRSWSGLLGLRQRLARAGETLADWSLEVLAA